MDTILCAAFCGTGKTFICQNMDTKAIEIEFYRYKGKEQISNFIADVEEQIGKVNYIFLSTDPISLSLLHDKGFNIILVYPENELRNEYLDRYIKRDSPHEFIGAFMKYWDRWINELKRLHYCKHIILKKGQYLYDILDDGNFMKPPE